MWFDSFGIEKDMPFLNACFGKCSGIILVYGADKLGTQSFFRQFIVELYKIHFGLSSRSMERVYLRF